MAKVSSGALMRHIIYLCFLALMGTSEGSVKILSLQELESQLGHLKNAKQISSDFSQSRLVKEWETEVKTSGTFEVVNGPHPRILWKILSPSYTAIKMEQQKLFVQSQNKSSEWKKLDNPKLIAQMGSVFAWLSMDSKVISRDFDVQQSEENFFLLIPKDKKTLFKSIGIELNEDRLVKRIAMLEKNGDSIHLQFTNTRLKK